jgi:8-oxo-dGTP pyrophosphatase MutT (NUDIX family)
MSSEAALECGDRSRRFSVPVLEKPKRRLRRRTPKRFALHSGKSMTRRAHLVEELRSYTPADALEAQHHRAIEKLLSGDGDPFSRNHFAPGHITASCFIVHPHGTSVLLHHHRRLGRWLQMGGHVEEGETPAQTALREGAEESGLDDLAFVSERVFDLDVHPIPAGKGEPDHHHFDIRFVARTERPDAIAIDRNESNDLAWVPLARAVALMNEEASTRAIRKIEWLMRERRDV